MLGVDPGTGRLGWSVLSSQKIASRRKTELLECGLIETRANTPLEERLEKIYQTLSLIVDKYSPDELAIEELFFVKNVKTGISVAHARGVVLLVAKQNGLKIYDYKPNEIKLGICGHGHATKRQIAKMLPYHLKGCKIEQDDVADAVAISLYHLQVSKG